MTYNENNSKKFNIRIIKAKGEPHKIKLKDLAKDIENNTQDDFRLRTNQNKMLFSKTITIIEPNEKKNKTTYKNHLSKNPPKLKF